MLIILTLYLVLAWLIFANLKIIKGKKNGCTGWR